MSLLQGDIEALRLKLETKNEQLETKVATISILQADKNRLNSEGADQSEQIKIKVPLSAGHIGTFGTAAAGFQEGKVAMLTRKVEGLEDLLKEKDGHIQKLQERLHNSPAVKHQRQMQVRPSGGRAMGDGRKGRGLAGPSGRDGPGPGADRPRAPWGDRAAGA